MNRAVAENDTDAFFVLQSFLELRAFPKGAEDFMKLPDFLLDSGAFTYLSSSAKAGNVTDWDGYVEKYAEVINHYNVKNFFELDIDPVVGIKEVERLRAKLESLTGKQSIPVWHPSRGKDYYDGMVKDYSYVAYGGLLTDGIKQATNEKAFPYFINKAHENNCKIHGLGYTSCTGIQRYHFDTVDSTTWLYGNKYGYIQHFNPNSRNLIIKEVRPKGTRLNTKKALEYSFKQWRKLQKYAYQYL